MVLQLPVSKDYHHLAVIQHLPAIMDIKLSSVKNFKVRTQPNLVTLLSFYTFALIVIAVQTET
jgi:hypothetical protein